MVFKADSLGKAISADHLSTASDLIASFQRKKTQCNRDVERVLTILHCIFLESEQEFIQTESLAYSTHIIKHMIYLKKCSKVVLVSSLVIKLSMKITLKR